MTKGRSTIAAAIAKRIGKPHEETILVPNRKGGFDEAPLRVPAITRARFDEHCAPVELFTKLLTELPALNMDIYADEATFRAERAKVRAVAAGIDRMERDVGTAVNWLAQHCDTADLEARIEAAAGKASLDHADAAETAETVWLGDETALRWRRAIAKAREFNAIRDSIARLLS